MLIISTQLKLRTSNLAGMIFGQGQGKVTPVNFWALNANCFNTAKVTDFKFEEHILWDSLEMSPKNLSKMGMAMVT